MRTTVEIPDALLQEARNVAASEGTTIRAMVEEGLRQVLSQRKSIKDFRLRKATFKGKGLQSGVSGASWETIREMAYEGRGG